MNATSIRSSQVFLILAGVGALTVLGCQLLEHKKVLHSLAQRLEESTAHQKQKGEHKETVVEKIVAKSDMWRPIQEMVKDTVVQVFAQVVKLDLLQPYKTPAQGSATGSAFFIDGAGYLITNAHVVNQALEIWIQIPSL